MPTNSRPTAWRKVGLPLPPRTVLAEDFSVLVVKRRGIAGPRAAFVRTPAVRY